MKKIDFNELIIKAKDGTGKTSRITGDFVRLVGREKPAFFLKKILAITFSEKSAIEMKSRILDSIYRDIYPCLDASGRIELENAMLRLNVSTIHSFCRRLLRRFAFYLDIDPFFRVSEEGQSEILFHRSFGRLLNGVKAESLADGILKEMKLNSLREILGDFQKSHPYVSAGVARGEKTSRMEKLFREVSEMHLAMKREISLLDFNDLENMACMLLADHPEAVAVLEDFDDMCSYIFVDEFQDTNIIQWKIIHKLAEEWLSGYGAKAEAGHSYGICLVGDRKQSIYRFRGAESGIFDIARESMSGFLKEEHLRKNYRSSGKIIDFVNRVFKDIFPWNEQNLERGLRGEAGSSVEIKIIHGSGAKEEEYDWVIGRIMHLVENSVPVWDRRLGRSRPIDFRDIAILMRGKSGAKFPLLEGKLKEAGLPFVILGGIGFYGEPEITFLLSVLFAVADSSDTFSLWVLANSIHRISPEDIGRWRASLVKEELSMVFERIMKEIGFMDGLSTQQKANVEKFLMVLESWQHMPLYSVAANLRDLALNFDEPKADIFSVTQNAVRILTVHGAKGLEFPAVFLVNLEDGNVSVRERVLYSKTEGYSPYAYFLKKEAGKEEEESFRQAQEEEETRVLYVALTRACNYLFISGQHKSGPSRLWLHMIEPLAEDYPHADLYGTGRIAKEESREEKETLIRLPDGLFLTSYSREADSFYYSYEKTMAGQVIHRLIHDLSTGMIRFDRDSFLERADFYLRKTGLDKKRGLKDSFSDIFGRIEGNPCIREVVEKNIEGVSFSELPFVVRKGDRIYEGFIDRVICENGVVSLYDYKTRGSIPSRYSEQMDIYGTAAKKIFKTDQVKKYVIFLMEGRICEVK